MGQWTPETAVMKVMRFHDNREWPEERILEWIQESKGFDGVPLEKAVSWAIRRERKPSLGEWVRRLMEERAVMNSGLQHAKADGRLPYDCLYPGCLDTGLVVLYFFSRDPQRKRNPFTTPDVACPKCRGKEAFDGGVERYFKMYGPGEWMSEREVFLYQVHRRIILRYWAMWRASREAKDIFAYAFRTGRHDVSRSATEIIGEDIRSRVVWPASTAQFDHATLEPLEASAEPEFARRLKAMGRSVELPEPEPGQVGKIMLEKGALEAEARMEKIRNAVAEFERANKAAEAEIVPGSPEDEDCPF